MLIINFFFTTDSFIKVVLFFFFNVLTDIFMQTTGIFFPAKENILNLFIRWTL